MPPNGGVGDSARQASSISARSTGPSGSQLAEVRTDARLRVDYVTLRGRTRELPIVLFSDRLSLAEVLGVEAPA